MAPVCGRKSTRHGAYWVLQVDVMRVLSIPHPASGTVDLVRGHPALTNRQFYFAHYAGHSELRFDDVELKACELYSACHKMTYNGQTFDVCFPEKQLSASWYAQVSKAYGCLRCSNV